MRDETIHARDCARGVREAIRVLEVAVQRPGPTSDAPAEPEERERFAAFHRVAVDAREAGSRRLAEAALAGDPAAVARLRMVLVFRQALRGQPLREDEKTRAREEMARLWVLAARPTTT